MFENGSDLPFLHALKPIKELFYRGAALKVLEEGGYGHPGSGEHPGLC